MMRFNLNRPTTLDDIQRYISSYPSPEEAQADTQQNSPAGYNYLVNQFQHLNQSFGASMADPFEVAKAERARQVTSAPAPVAPTISGVAPAVTSELARMMAPPNYSQGAAHDIAGDMLRRKALMENMGARLATKDWQIKPDSSQSLIEERAIQTGHADLYRQIMREDPSALATSQSTDDPRMALLPSASRQPKIVADDNLHPIVNNARFKELEGRDLASASRFYYAVSGRDYDTDQKAKALLLSNQEGERRKLIGSIKNPEIDQFDGKLYHTIERANPATGQMESQRVPVDEIRAAALQKEGGFSGTYGINVAEKGLARLPNTTDAEHQKYIDTARQIFAKHPELGVQGAAKEALLQLHTEQEKNARIATQKAIPPASDAGTDLMEVAAFMRPSGDIIRPLQNVGRNIWNTLVDSPQGPSPFRSPLRGDTRMSRDELDVIQKMLEARKKRQYNPALPLTAFGM